MRVTRAHEAIVRAELIQCGLQEKPQEKKKKKKYVYACSHCARTLSSSATRDMLRIIGGTASRSARGVSNIGLSGRSLSSAAAGAATAAGKGKLVVFDTTLRDGEQSPGCTLQRAEKLAVAHALNALGVDVCEAGFPVASQGDFDAVQAIAREVGSAPGPTTRPQPMVIAGLARALEKDIDRCYEAVRLAPRHRIHTFLATSDIHVRVAENDAPPHTCTACPFFLTPSL